MLATSFLITCLVLASGLSSFPCLFHALIVLVFFFFCTFSLSGRQPGFFLFLSFILFIVFRGIFQRWSASGFGPKSKRVDNPVFYSFPFLSSLEALSRFAPCTHSRGAGAAMQLLLLSYSFPLIWGTRGRKYPFGACFFTDVHRCFPRLLLELTCRLLVLRLPTCLRTSRSFLEAR